MSTFLDLKDNEYCRLRRHVINYNTFLIVSSPKTAIGKIVIIGVIVVAISLLPVQISKLSSLMAAGTIHLYPKYLEKSHTHYKGRNHVVVSSVNGDMTDFLTEFFHPVVLYFFRTNNLKDRVYNNLNIVFLTGAENFTTRIKARYRKRVKVVEGTLSVYFF